MSRLKRMDVLLVLLHSSTAAQAHDHALLATKIATSAKRAVLHFFEDVSGAVDEVTNVDLASFVGSAIGSSSTDAAAKTNGVNGHSNGVNGANGTNGSHHHADTGDAPLNAIIVGAGIGGLTAAIYLRQQGHRVTVSFRIDLSLSGA